MTFIPRIQKVLAISIPNLTKKTNKHSIDVILSNFNNILNSDYLAGTVLLKNVSWKM